MEDGCVKWSPKKVTRPTEAPEPEPESKGTKKTYFGKTMMAN